MIFKLFKEESKRLAVEVKRVLLNTRTRLDCFHKSLKGLMALLKERTMRSEPWEEKFKALKKT